MIKDERQLQEDWESFQKELGQIKGFRGFILGFAVGAAISIFWLISIPLSIVNRSWKWHPKYHDTLFGVLFMICSFGLSIGIRFCVREIANDVGDINGGNFSDSSTDVNIAPITDMSNQSIDDESVTQNSEIINNNNIPVIFDSQSGMLYANDGHELVHLINHCLISNDGKIIARYDQSINLFYDEFNRPIDVTIDGTNFQHVNLINRKGLDIINGEVFDAETHNRISSITVVHKAKDFDAL